MTPSLRFTLAAVSLAAAFPLPAQPPRPLSKSNLIRLLSGPALTKDEVTGIIRANCTTFTPSERDREDLLQAGADTVMLGLIDACRREAERLRLRLAASEVAAVAGNEATLRAEVRRGSGPARGITLSLVGSGRIPGADGRDVQATTDEHGIAVFAFPVGSVIATYALTVEAVSGQPLTGNRTVTVVTRPSGPLRGEVRPRRVDLQPGQAGQTVTVVVRDALGNAVAGQRVELIAAGGAAPPQSRATDTRGEAAFHVAAASFRSDARLAVRVAGRVVDSLEVVLPALAAAARTGFVSGHGQQGRVGAALPLALVFEVRDSANIGLADRAVSVTAVNAVAEPDRARTDAEGRLVIRVRLGPRAGAASVTARVGGIERQAALLALAGPATRLHLACIRESNGRVLLAADAPNVLLVSASDAFGNPVPFSGARATVGDDGIARVEGIAPAGARTRITLRGRRPGSTNLAIYAAGLRADFVATVQAGAAPGECRVPD